MTSLLFPAFIADVQLWIMFLGAQSVDGALGRGDAEVNPVVLSDFQTSEKEETNPLSTAILNTSFIWKIFGGSKKNKNIFPFDSSTYQLFFILRPRSERKASGVLILQLHNFKSSAYSKAAESNIS